jgi:hypothetical protein
MPFKHNAARRYRVQNWPTYEAGLKRRGDRVAGTAADHALRQAEGFVASVLRLLGQEQRTRRLSGDYRGMDFGRGR